jgi:hypothetical protein
MQGSAGQLLYKNIRLVKVDPAYHYVGATHEYLHAPPEHRGHLIDAGRLRIDDVGDGVFAEQHPTDRTLLGEQIVRGNSIIRSIATAGVALRPLISGKSQMGN